MKIGLFTYSPLCPSRKNLIQFPTQYHIMIVYKKKSKKSRMALTSPRWTRLYIKFGIGGLKVFKLVSQFPNTLGASGPWKLSGKRRKIEWWWLHNFSQDCGDFSKQHSLRSICAAVLPKKKVSKSWFCNFPPQSYANERIIWRDKSQFLIKIYTNFQANFILQNSSFFLSSIPLDSRQKNMLNDLRQFHYLFILFHRLIL